MPQRLFHSIAVISALLLSEALLPAIPPKPSPQRLVNDYANILSVRQAAELEQRLVAFDDSTSNQIVVLTVTDLEEDDPNWYAAQVGRSWGVGGSKNNGIVLLVKPKIGNSYGEVAIQVGYGLEGAIPDAYCNRIIDDLIIPKFKEGYYYKGICLGVEELAALACGEISEPRDGSDDTGELIAAIISVLFVVAILVLLALASRKGGGGSGNNNGGSGGGRDRVIIIGGIPFGGSSGSFGGGRAGGGFGGFGGGSFGGGGASGRW